MIVGECFPSDTDKDLMHAQSEVYLEQLWVLFEEARRAIVDTKSKSQLGVDAWLMSDALKTERFDHRPLQRLHDLMAASFRRWLRPAEQIPFADDAEAVRRFKIKSWRSYVASEARSLCADAGLAKAIVVAVVRANTDEGYAAEAILSSAVDERYGAKPGTWSDISEVPPGLADDEDFETVAGGA